MKFLLPLLAVALVLVLVGAGWNQKSIKPEPGCLRINLGTEPPSLDWSVTVDNYSFDVIANLMVGLTQYRNNLTCKPSVASSWDVLNGGKRYVFHLRKDVVWSDGKPVTANDFIYAWRRMLTPATAAQNAFLFYDIINAYEFNTGKVKDFQQVGIKAPDDYTLEVNLRRPVAYFINITALSPAFPLRQDIVERYGDSWCEPGHIVTNGPFLLTKWQHEYKIELAANPRFFEGEPKLKKIKYFMVPEPSTALALYENGELDFIDNRSFPTPDVERYRTSPQYHNYPLLRNNYVGFNVTKKPFDNKLVRQAFSAAIDREVFPKILRRKEFPSSCWIPPSLMGYDANSGPKFDAARAQKLLAEAGYPDGKGLPPITFLYPQREDVRLVVEAMQDQLKRNLHVNVELINQEWKVFLATCRNDAPQMYRSSWGADYPDPETFMSNFTSRNGNNHTRWKNKTYDDLVERAGGEPNQSKRAALYKEADTLLCKEESPLICTYLASQNILVRPWVKGLEFNAMDLQFFKTAYIETKGFE